MIKKFLIGSFFLSTLLLYPEENIIPAKLEVKIQALEKIEDKKFINNHLLHEFRNAPNNPKKIVLPARSYRLILGGSAAAVVTLAIVASLSE